MGKKIVILNGSPRKTGNGHVGDIEGKSELQATYKLGKSI